MLTLRLEITATSRQTCKYRSTYDTPLGQEPWRRRAALPTMRLEEPSLAHPPLAFRNPCAQCRLGTHRCRRQGAATAQGQLYLPGSEPSRPALHQVSWRPWQLRGADPHWDGRGPFWACSLVGAGPTDRLLRLCPCRNILSLTNEFDFPDQSISRDEYAAVLTHLNATQPERLAGLHLESCRLQDFLDKVLRAWPCC